MRHGGHSCSPHHAGHMGAGHHHIGIGHNTHAAHHQAHMMHHNRPMGTGSNLFHRRGYGGPMYYTEAHRPIIRCVFIFGLVALAVSVVLIFCGILNFAGVIPGEVFRIGIPLLGFGGVLCLAGIMFACISRLAMNSITNNQGQATGETVYPPPEQVAINSEFNQTTDKGGFNQPPYGQPPSNAPYGQPPSSAPYGQPPSNTPYGQPPSNAPYGQPPSNAPYGQPPSNAPYGQPPSNAPYGQPPSNAQANWYPPSAPASAPPPYVEATVYPGQASDAASTQAPYPQIGFVAPNANP